MLAGRLLSGLRPHLPRCALPRHRRPAHDANRVSSVDWPMETLTVRGLFEVIPRYREIKGIQNCLARPPAGRAAGGVHRRRLPRLQPRAGDCSCKQAGIPTVHFVSPQIWAWRGGRIKKIAQGGVAHAGDFPVRGRDLPQGRRAGHLRRPSAGRNDSAAARPGGRRARALGIDAGCARGHRHAGQPHVRTEIQLAAPFVGAAKLLLQRDPALQLRRADGRRAPARTISTSWWPRPAWPMSRCSWSTASRTRRSARPTRVLVASGTATLEVALFKKPMVIAYKMMARLLADHAPHELSAVDRLAEHPGARIPGARTAAGRRHAAGAGRRAVAAAERRARPPAAGAALHRHASQPAAQQRAAKARTPSCASSDGRTLDR